MSQITPAQNPDTSSSHLENLRKRIISIRQTSNKLKSRVEGSLSKMCMGLRADGDGNSDDDDDDEEGVWSLADLEERRVRVGFYKLYAPGGEYGGGAGGGAGVAINSGVDSSVGAGGGVSDGIRVPVQSRISTTSSRPRPHYQREIVAPVRGVRDERRLRTQVGQEREAYKGYHSLHSGRVRKAKLNEAEKKYKSVRERNGGRGFTINDSAYASQSTSETTATPSPDGYVSPPVETSSFRLPPGASQRRTDQSYVEYIPQSPRKESEDSVHGDLVYPPSHPLYGIPRHQHSDFFNGLSTYTLTPRTSRIGLDSESSFGCVGSAGRGSDGEMVRAWRDMLTASQQQFVDWENLASRVGSERGEEVWEEVESMARNGDGLEEGKEEEGENGGQKKKFRLRNLGRKSCWKFGLPRSLRHGQLQQQPNHPNQSHEFQDMISDDVEAASHRSPTFGLEQCLSNPLHESRSSLDPEQPEMKQIPRQIFTSMSAASMNDRLYQQKDHTHTSPRLNTTTAATTINLAAEDPLLLTDVLQTLAQARGVLQTMVQHHENANTPPNPSPPPT
ncbi:hypothetical protein T440DRAFT_536960 [Plenodomus tracheiphilus IPT5]|uniref:Uncharacterized protein n=1 Tax=Plenodomus tracheiphilus IPT5 TaxID=1408161 RepID=A0A6A7AYR1_9PLEO|nr:hypothetical protein T440DRAFT_536960 [Plenodomus tracheiphilus IPT5]